MSPGICSVAAERAATKPGKVQALEGFQFSSRNSMERQLLTAYFLMETKNLSRHGTGKGGEDCVGVEGMCLQVTHGFPKCPLCPS